MSAATKDFLIIFGGAFVSAIAIILIVWGLEAWGLIGVPPCP